MGVVEQFRSAASELVARSALARWAGKTFGDKRDMYEALGYKRDLTVQDYRSRYERGGVAGTVVEAKPEATWREGGEVIEVDESDETTQFETAWEALNERLDIWSVFFKTDVLAGLGRYSIILLGAPGTFDTPLKRLKPDDLAYLWAFAEDDAQIDDLDLERDSSSPRFSMPNFYTLPQIKTLTGTVTKAHWSRIVHVRAEGVPDGVLYGPPRMRRVWNYFDDLDKVVGGGSEAFWVRANQGYVFNLDKEARLKPEEKTKMSDQVTEFEHGMRRALKLQGVEVKTLGSDVADFGPAAEKIIMLISGSTGIPQRLFVGSERGELSSTQDRENWSDRIDSRRTQYAHPFIVKPFVQRLVELKTLPAPTTFKTRWPNQITMTETEKADLTVKLTKANQQQGEDVVTTDEMRDTIWGKQPLSGDQKQRKPPAPTPDVPPTDNSGIR